MLSLSLPLSFSLFHIAITHEAEQIYYSQNYWVADTNEQGLGTCSKVITALALLLKLGQHCTLPATVVRYQSAATKIQQQILCVCVCVCVCA